MRFSFRRKGATAVEYGLLIGLLGIAIVAAVTATGRSVGDIFALGSEAMRESLATNAPDGSGGAGPGSGEGGGVTPPVYDGTWVEGSWASGDSCVDGTMERTRTVSCSGGQCDPGTSPSATETAACPRLCNMPQPGMSAGGGTCETAVLSTASLGVAESLRRWCETKTGDVCSGSVIPGDEVQAASCSGTVPMYNGVPTRYASICQPR